MWYKLDYKIRISVLTLVGETDAEAIFNSIGQESFGASLASFLNIGCAIFYTTKNEFITDLGPMPLKWISFQDDIARMNSTLYQV